MQQISMVAQAKLEAERWASWRLLEFGGKLIGG